MTAILAGPGIGETLSGKLRQSKRVVEFAKGEQTGVGGDFRTVELQLQVGIKGDAQSGLVCFTRRTVHVWPHSHQLSFCSIEQNRVRASLRNVRIWGMRVRIPLESSPLNLYRTIGEKDLAAQAEALTMILKRPA